MSVYIKDMEMPTTGLYLVSVDNSCGKDETVMTVKRMLGNRDVCQIIGAYNLVPVPVVRCKDCVYWQKPQIMLDDGTYSDYMDGESVGMVSISVGINIGSNCALYDREHKNRIPQFMGPDDFCSKGYKAKMDGEV